MVLPSLDVPPDLSVISIQGNICALTDTCSHIIYEQHKEEGSKYGALGDPRYDFKEDISPLIATR